MQTAILRRSSPFLPIILAALLPLAATRAGAASDGSYPFSISGEIKLDLKLELPRLEEPPGVRPPSLELKSANFFVDDYGALAVALSGSSAGGCLPCFSVAVLALDAQGTIVASGVAALALTRTSPATHEPVMTASATLRLASLGESLERIKTARIAIVPSPSADAGGRYRDKKEAPHLAASEGRASRAGDLLTIDLDGAGLPRTYKDDLTLSEGGLHYRYKGKLAGLPYHDIRVNRGEDGTWLLLSDETGIEHAIASDPSVSPDKKRILASNEEVDEIGGGGGNRLQIWKVRERGLELEFELGPEKGDAFVFGAEWVSPEEVRFKRLIRDPALKEGRARLEGGAWKLYPPAAEPPAAK